MAPELVDILPPLNGTLPYRKHDGWLIARDGKLVEVSASLGVIEQVDERVVDNLAAAILTGLFQLST